MELFLKILSTTGIVVLIVLLVALFLIALVLFLPIVYRVKLKKTNDFEAEGCIRWLFGIVWFGFAYDRTGFSKRLRIFGICVRKRKKRRKAAGAKKGKKRKKSRADKKPENISDKKPSDINAADVGTDKPGIAEKLRFTFKNICDKLKTAGQYMPLLDKVMPSIKKLIGVLAPKKAVGYVDFGFNDPAKTGIAIAILSLLCIPIPKGLEVTPYFDEEIFEFDVKIGGRIAVISPIVIIIKLLKIPEVRGLLKKRKRIK